MKRCVQQVSLTNSAANQNLKGKGAVVKSSGMDVCKWYGARDRSGLVLSRKLCKLILKEVEDERNGSGDGT